MRLLVPLLLLLACFSCSDPPPAATHDLVVINAAVLNTLTGEVETRQTIVIDSGYISAVLDSGAEIDADTIIDAHNKLVTPGFIETVGHLDDVFGDRPDTLKASVEECVKTFTDTYLPYGVTTVRSSGDGTGYYAIADYLVKSDSHNAPEFLFCGGSLAGWYDGSPYVNHLLVQDSSEADYWVSSMYKTGSIGTIKIYCNGAMSYPIFTAALNKARGYGMNVTAQVQNEITIDSALSLGLKNFEHASTLVYQRNLFHFTNDAAFNDTLDKYYHQQEEGSRIYPYMEAALKTGPNNPQVLSTIAKMKAYDASMTTSLHFFAQWIGKCYFCSTPKAARFDTHSFTPEQKARCAAGYAVLSGYVKQMYDAGILLAIGTDHKDGGKAMLSEMLLLHETGIPMNDCFRIATINSARVIGADEFYGSITAGKRANMILFEENPLDDPQALLKGKTVIKDGMVYKTNTVQN